VESSDGWTASVYARYQQARRHSQGIAELSYVFLQYAHLIGETGFSGLPVATHTKILGIASKMVNVHIVNQVQSLALLFAMLSFIYGAISWIYFEDISAILQAAGTAGYFNAVYNAVGGLDGIMKYVLAILGPLPPTGVIMTITSWLVVVDVLEGRLTQEYENNKDGSHAKQDIHRPQALTVRAGETTLGFWRRMQLMINIWNDYINMAQFTLLAYGLVPSCQACWSLFRFGHKFEYIVAAKPV
jgi:hypothetical protein